MIGPLPSPHENALLPSLELLLRRLLLSELLRFEPSLLDPLRPEDERLEVRFWVLVAMKILPAGFGGSTGEGGGPFLLQGARSDRFGASIRARWTAPAVQRAQPRRCSAARQALPVHPAARSWPGVVRSRGFRAAGTAWCFHIPHREAAALCGLPAAEPCS